jgi:hypothetical protein
MSLETSRLRFTGVNVVNGVYELETERQTVTQAMRFVPGLNTYTPTDTDARSYIAAVQVADNEPLESSVKQAIDLLFINLKAGGFWDKIGVAYLFSGARTPAGALVPLRGPLPTNNGFLQTDYHRLWGLKSDGTKWLDSNRPNNTDGQNDSHNAIWLHTPNPSHLSCSYIGSGTDAGSNQFNYSNNRLTRFRQRSVGQNDISFDSQLTTGIWGASRSNDNNFNARAGLVTLNLPRVSSEPNSRNVLVFGRNSDSGVEASTITNGRLRWYSAGGDISLEGLELVLAEYFQQLQDLQPTQLNVFLISGQSNAEGRTALNLAPEYLSGGEIPNVLMYHGTNIDNYYLKHYGQRGNGAFWSYTPGTTYWGPFDVTMKRLAEVLPNVLALRVSAGGSILDSIAPANAGRGSWSDRFDEIPDGTPSLLQALEQRVQSLKDWAEVNNVQLIFRGMLWHQGASDFTRGGDSITNYESNWIDFVSYVRSFTVANLPIVYGTITNLSSTFNATIKAAHLSVAANDENMFCRDNDGLTVFDPNHFTAESNVIFGEWAASTWLENYEDRLMDNIFFIPGISPRPAIATAVDSVGDPLTPIDYTDSDGRDWRAFEFLDDGELVVTRAGQINALIVAGGGGGGSRIFGGGGGGAGGLIQDTFNVSIGTHSIIVGSGGAGGSDAAAEFGSDGSSSELYGRIANGGGGGGAAAAGGVGRAGGCGGGGGQSNLDTDPTSNGGVGSQGGSGGSSAVRVANGSARGGGGGGAGGNGSDGVTGVLDTPGGPGIASVINGTSKTYAVGGTGSVSDPVPAPIANTGNGGAGAGGLPGSGFRNAGDGASGVVVVRFRR